MKTRFIMPVMLAGAILFSACEKTGNENNGGTPEEPEIVVPEGFGTLVYEDGSVLVESDYAQNTVNNLINAYKKYAGMDAIPVRIVDPESGEVVETGETVKCSNVFYLQRGGYYFIEGKGKITSEREVTDEATGETSAVTVDKAVFKAEDGDGAMPVIQPIADSQGATASDMMVIEIPVEFHDIYFDGNDPMAGSIMQRMLRIEAKNGSLLMNNCFANYCANSFVRIEAEGISVNLENSTFRNLAKGFSSNGRLIDTRGNDTKSVIMNNCLVYNMVGRIIRYDGCVIDDLQIKNSTFYNCGYGMQFDAPKKVLVENCIFADSGWYTSSDAYERVTDGGEFVLDGQGNKILTNYFWDIINLTTEEEDGTITVGDVTGVDVVIRNNNVFTSPAMAALYALYPETAHAPLLGLDDAEQALADAGVVTFENNIEETIEFENAPALPEEFLKERLETLTKEETVREDFCADGTFSFGYADNYKSATAATDGGILGVR